MKNIPENQLFLCKEVSFYQVSIVENPTAIDSLIQAKTKISRDKNLAFKICQVLKWLYLEL